MNGKIKLCTKNLEELTLLFYINLKKIDKDKGISFWVKNRISKKTIQRYFTIDLYNIKDNILVINEESTLYFKEQLFSFFNIDENIFDSLISEQKKKKNKNKKKKDIENEDETTKKIKKIKEVKKIVYNEDEKKERQIVKENERIQKAYNFVKKELPELYNKIKKEEAYTFDPFKGKNISNEETYYREIGKIYKFKYIKNQFKELIFLYKKSDLFDGIFDIEDRERKIIKELLILCNMGIVLKVLDGLIPIAERASYDIGSFISEAMKTVVESIEKYQLDFTSDKIIKGTKIFFKGVDEKGNIKAIITGNKPFANIDIAIKNKEEDINESVNVELDWKEQDDGSLVADVYLDQLENDYSENQNISLSISKKVGHPSTFITTNVFYAIKNFFNKKEILKISNNHYILNNQVSKVKEKYIEKFDKEPSLRWIAYYLLTQNSKIITLSKEDEKDIEKIKDFKKRKCIKLNETKKDISFLEDTNSQKRKLMMKTKDIENKNKNNYLYLNKDVTGDEDLYLYSEEFEKILLKKEKSINRARLSYSEVVSLDQKVGKNSGSGDDKDSTIEQFLGTTEDFENLINESLNTFQRDEFKEKIKIVLSPREYFFIGLYFFKRIDLETISTIGFYSPDNLIELRKIIKEALTKVSFYTKYKYSYMID